MLPIEKQGDRKEQGQDKVTPLVYYKTTQMKHSGYPLISKVDSQAPVYGMQFNIQEGTKPIFKNFFDMVCEYFDKAA